MCLPSLVSSSRPELAFVREGGLDRPGVIVMLLLNSAWNLRLTMRPIRIVSRPLIKSIFFEI